MLNKTMWNIFKQTGNIHAYLYIKQYDKNYYNKNDKNNICSKVALEIKEIKIVT